MSLPEPAPVTSPQAPSSSARGFALAALIVGIIAFLSGLLPVAGLLLGAGAIALAAITLINPAFRPLDGTTRLLAIIGGILAAIAVLTSMLILVVGIVFS